jgi:prepilin-type N-terminal cleavage/methylation domain-containing protein
MRPVTRRGVTLVELLVGLVLLAMLGLAITRTLATASGATARALRGLVVARTLMATGTLLREELGQGVSADVALPSTTAVDFNRVIGAGPLCGVAGSVVLLRGSEWRGVRWPEEARDNVMLLTDVSAGTWSTIAIDSVANGNCSDGANAIRLTLAAAAGPAVYARVTEPVRLREYASGGSGWWGLAAASGLSPVQPFAGPLDMPLQPLLSSPAVLQLNFRPTFGSDTTLRVPLGPP